MANNTIILRARQRWTKERAAGGAITPGHLIELDTAGDVVVHSTAAGVVAQKAFALEDQAQGRGIDVAYATGENVIYQVFTPGEEVYALLENAAAAVIGSPLESAGDGTLQIRTTGQVVAYALEALTASGAERIKVEVA